MQLMTADVVDGMCQALIQGGRTLSQNLMPLAQAILGGVVTLQMIVFGLGALMESWVGDQLGAVLARFCRLVLMVATVSFLISDYDAVFYGGVYELGTEVVSAVAGPLGEKQTFATAWNVFMDLMLSMWHLIESTPAAMLQAGNPAQGSFWGSVVLVLLSLLVLYSCVVAFAISLVLLALVHVMGAALTGFALALGPVFLPWLVFQGSRPLFEGWLHFLLTASFYRVVAVTLLTLAAPIFTALQSTLSAGGDPLQSQTPLDILLSSLGLLIASSLIAGMMVKAPQLAQALIGHARIDTGSVTDAGRSVFRIVQGAGSRPAYRRGASKERARS